MVKVRDEQQVLPDGTIDIDDWLSNYCEDYPASTKASLERALAYASQLCEPMTHAEKQTIMNHGLSMAETLSALHLDVDTLSAAILFPLQQRLDITEEQIIKHTNEHVWKLLSGALKMDVLSLTVPQNAKPSQTSDHLDKLRKMLLAMAEDARVVLIKLAEHLSCLREVKNEGEFERRHMATLAQDIFAPLANRLGVGQIKWELEDLALRYLQPADYKRIAKLLDERRVDRERYIKRVIETLETALAEDNIVSQVKGRVKHIFSIWRKMKRKNLDYHEIHDVRAVRIIVDNIKTCYSALGIVHTLWKHIPKEFDDYIATPKPNGYQSLHTAVIGPEGKTIEVQIRTQQMHQDSELGVAAHWRYKEGVKHDASYEDKLIWLRQLLDWQSEISDASELMDELKTKVLADRIYVLTPKGDVFDLPNGATPLDFAYHVHTQIGHCCRGAKVNGRIVPLTYQLQTGEQVEIIRGTSIPSPSRDWLNPNLGYLQSSRARSKVQVWFKQQNKDKNIAEGKSILDRELQKLGVESINYDSIASKFNVSSGDDVLAAVATGDIRIQHVLNAAEVSIPSDDETAEPIPFKSTRPEKEYQAKDITIAGVGNMLTSVAKCCQPLPGDPIIGYITQGRGITVHRDDCPNILHIQEVRHERLIEVSWGGGAKTYPVDISIEAYDRPNLLKDIMNCIANEKINITAMNTKVNRSTNTVHNLLTLEITDLDSLSTIMDRILQIPNTIHVKRHH